MSDSERALGAGERGGGGAPQSAGPVILGPGAEAGESRHLQKAPAFAIRAAFLWQRELKEVRQRNGKQRAIVRDRLSAVFHRGTAAPACSCEAANPVHP